MANSTSQSRWVIIRPEPPGRFRVTVTAGCPADVTVMPLDAGRCEADVTANVRLATSGVDDIAIRLELAKLAYQDHGRTLGFASQLIAAASASGAPAGGILETPGEAVRVAHAVRALLARKAPVDGWTRQVIASGLRAAVLAIAAFPGPAWLVARHGGSPPTCPPETRIWHAVHGERETRTRHLLPPAYDPQSGTAYLVLGRPRDRLATVRRILDPSAAMAHVPLLRPLSFASCLRALPRAAVRIGKLIHALSRSPVPASPRDVAALSFRIVQGEAHRVWWRRLDHPPGEVAFAHTGTADTTALEQAIQERGGRTHHIAHGVNTGWPFAAISNTGTFVCGHDAAAARNLPAYGATRHLPVARPALRSGDGRWLLLTAYTHPMGRSYATDGIKPDLDALETVAAAARRCGVDPHRIIWRPHPAISKVATADRAAVESRAAALGFTPWPPDDPLSAMADYGVVITTPSTVLLDALGLGKLPVLLSTVPLQSDLLYASYPLHATTAESLAAVVALTGDEPTFQSAWDALAPGAMPRTPADLTRKTMAPSS